MNYSAYYSLTVILWKQLLVGQMCLCALVSPLQVMKEPLFRGEPVPAELHLVVCQTPPPMHTVVVGCRYIHICMYMY